MKSFVISAAVLFWNFLILVGTAYIVFWQGHSGWWWLLAILLMSGSASVSDKTKSTTQRTGART